MIKEMEIQSLMDAMYNKLNESKCMTEEIDKSYKDITKNYHNSILKELNNSLYNHSMEVRRYEAM